MKPNFLLLLGALVLCLGAPLALAQEVEITQGQAWINGQPTLEAGSKKPLAPFGLLQLAPQARAKFKTKGIELEAGGNSLFSLGPAGEVQLLHGNFRVKTQAKQAMTTPFNLLEFIEPSQAWLEVNQVLTLVSLHQGRLMVQTQKGPGVMMLSKRLQWTLRGSQAQTARSLPDWLPALPESMEITSALKPWKASPAVELLLEIPWIDPAEIHQAQGEITPDKGRYDQRRKAQAQAPTGAQVVEISPDLPLAEEYTRLPQASLDPPAPLPFGVEVKRRWTGRTGNLAVEFDK